MLLILEMRQEKEKKSTYQLELKLLVGNIIIYIENSKESQESYPNF